MNKLFAKSKLLESFLLHFFRESAGLMRCDVSSTESQHSHVRLPGKDWSLTLLRQSRSGVSATRFRAVTDDTRQWSLTSFGQCLC